MFSRVILAGVLIAVSAGNYVISDDWNRLLPEYKFIKAEEFLVETWCGKP